MGGYIRRVVGRMGGVISDVLLVEWGGYIRRVVGRMGGVISDVLLVEWGVLYQTCCW